MHESTAGYSKAHKPDPKPVHAGRSGTSHLKESTIDACTSVSSRAPKIVARTAAS